MREAAFSTIRSKPKTVALSIRTTGRHYRELKSRDQMEWIRQANNVRSRVDEIILNELVYA